MSSTVPAWPTTTTPGNRRSPAPRPRHLVGALDRLRTTFRWKADDLDAAGLQTRIGASSLTLGALLKHLARAEDEMFTIKLGGAPRSAPWDTAPWDADPDWDFTSAADDTPDELYALWDSTIERSRAKLAAALADGGLDQPVHMAWPGRAACQPAPAGLRPHRGVRAAHRARRPDPRSRRRACRRGPAGRLATPQPRPHLRLTNGRPAVVPGTRVRLA